MLSRVFPCIFVGALLFAQGTTAQAQTPPKAGKRGEEALAEKVYPVADLIIPIKMGLESDKDEPKTLERSLMDLIRASVAPESWSERQGLSEIRYFPLGMSFVIRQSPEVHARIQAFLADLRRPQDIEVSVVIRLLTVSDSAGEAMDAIIGGFETDQANGQGLAHLSDEQILRIMKDVQKSPSTQVWQAPKVTVFNGQRAAFGVTQAQKYVTGVEKCTFDGKLTFTPKTETIETGTKCLLRPVVSDDRRTVELSVCLSLTHVDEQVPLYPLPLQNKDGKPHKEGLTMVIQQPKVATIKVERVLKIADGRTALIAVGTQISEGRIEQPEPTALNKLLSFCRLVKNVGYGRETQRVFIMVTPRVIVSQEMQKITAPSRE
jgi:general secretion pathway protein D